MSFSTHYNRLFASLTIPGTASDWRSPANTRSDLRKLLRQDGLLEMKPNGAPAGPEPRLCRRQLEELIRRLNQVQVPEQVRAERSEIVAALRELLNRTIQQQENGHGAKGSEV